MHEYIKLTYICIHTHIHTHTHTHTHTHAAAVMIVTDVFGFELPNVRLVADKIAEQGLSVRLSRIITAVCT
jgi:hypothetical protein